MKIPLNCACRHSTSARHSDRRLVQIGSTQRQPRSDGRRGAKLDGGWGCWVSVSSAVGLVPWKIRIPSGVEKEVSKRWRSWLFMLENKEEEEGNEAPGAELFQVYRSIRGVVRRLGAVPAGASD